MQAFRHRIGHYADLPDAVWQRLEATPHRIREYPRLHSLVREGQRLTDVHILQRGMAIRKRIVEDGRRQIVNFVLPGNVFDLQALIETEADHGVEAITPCETRLIDRHDFMQAAVSHADFISALWWAAIQEEALLREHLVLLGQRRAIERVAHLLIELRRRLLLSGECRDDDIVSLPITRSQIADTLGLSSVHVSRTISELKRMKLVRTNRAVEILDPECLAAISGFDQAHLHLGAEPLPQQWLLRVAE